MKNKFNNPKPWPTWLVVLASVAGAVAFCGILYFLNWAFRHTDIKINFP